MKIIIWNCNMAFRKKADWILAYEPDILVIPECEHPDKLKLKKLPADVVWYGSNPNKGLGVFSYGDYKLKILQEHNPDLKTIIPISIASAIGEFTLFAIWANNPADKGNQYVGQVWKAIHYYARLIKPYKTILAGDFNSNSIWDKPRRIGNHTALVDALATKGVKSVYHNHLGYAHGKEGHPTFHLYKDPGKPYHLDYCFVSQDLMEKVQYVEIGQHAQWKTHSDHIPLIIHLDMNN